MKDHKYIGGTLASAVLGLNRWHTPLQAWALLTDQIKEEDISDRIEVKLGNKLEQTVAELFMEETGKKVHRVNETLFHPKYDFLGANIDRRVVGENAVLECKTATMWKYREWQEEEIPQEYLIQVLHYMAIGGFEKGYIACLIGNHKFVWKEIEYDKKTIDDLIAKEVHFWKTFVEPCVMPMQIKANDSDVLYQLFSNTKSDSEIGLDAEADRILDMIDSMEADLKGLEKQIEQYKNEIKARLQDKEIGKTEHWKVTWKEMVTKRLDNKALKQDKPKIYEEYTKETKTRVLRIYDLKGEKDETAGTKQGDSKGTGA